MSKPVKLEVLIDEMESQFEGYFYYSNRDTGEIVMVGEEIFTKAEDEDPIDGLEDWEQIEYAQATDILEHPSHYLELPDKEEINEYRMMENFCYSLNDGPTKERLISAIQGRRAFRRFKDQVDQLGLRKEWFAFRKNCYREEALDWCELHGLEYE
ncbi:UPF0158 family protein [Rossellomorea vietnamensis]|uniref:Uncharacterized protein n=1 Tax=Rossellomorea vietnamensis TaxID=218284 RepID=A0A0P6WQ34_9BACI|nr:UPF0158 family protein [Rossellomorea vietnamensis]KPL58453.1 hypothetical protein AM506_16490 [Rossellomorea vietnamensis]